MIEENILEYCKLFIGVGMNSIQIRKFLRISNDEIKECIDNFDWSIMDWEKKDTLDKFTATKIILSIKNGVTYEELEKYFNKVLLDDIRLKKSWRRLQDTFDGIILRPVRNPNIKPFELKKRIIKHREMPIIERHNIKLEPGEDILVAISPHYDVSSLGKIFKDGVEIKIELNSNGVAVAKIDDRFMGVAMLVANAFLSRDKATYKYINHKDNCSLNNEALNLECSNTRRLTNEMKEIYDYKKSKEREELKENEKLSQRLQQTLKWKMIDQAYQISSRDDVLSIASRKILKKYKDSEGAYVKIYGHKYYIKDLQRYADVSEEFVEDLEISPEVIKDIKIRAYRGEGISRLVRLTGYSKYFIETIIRTSKYISILPELDMSLCVGKKLTYDERLQILIQRGVFKVRLASIFKENLDRLKGRDLKMESIVPDIKKALKEGDDIELSKRFGVSKTAIHDIRTGRRWAEISPEIALEKKEKKTILKAEDIPDIRDMLAFGVAQKTVAEVYKVSPTAIRSIAIGRSWRHV